MQMSSAVKILPHYTYADYVQWEGKWKIIEGIPYAMSPAPVPKHQVVAGNLHSEFRQELKSCKTCKVYLPIDYLVKDDTILQPDLLIVCGEITKKYLDFPLALVVEVTSPSTEAKDRFSKFTIYQDKGIHYYLIIDPISEEVEIFEHIDGQYKMTAKGKSFIHDFILDGCNASIDFKEIWS